MNVLEYFTPILKIKKPLDELKFKFRNTLNKYLPKEDQIVEQTLFDKLDGGGLNQVQDELDDNEDLSIRRFQALRSHTLSDEIPSILECYMELVIQFGYIVLFAGVFPLGAVMSLISNYIQIMSQVGNLQYTRRFKSEVSSGIGSWMMCLETLAQLSIITNCATVYFTSKIYYKMFVAEAFDEDNKVGAIYIPKKAWQLTQFLLFVVLIEHVILIFKMMIENEIEDTPAYVIQGQYERQALVENFM